MALDPKQLRRINEVTGGTVKQAPTIEVEPRVAAIQENIAQSLMRARRSKQAGIISP